MLNRSHAGHRLSLIALFLAALFAGGIGGTLAQNDPETAVPDLPCAPLAAYAADLTTGIAGGGRRNRGELLAAQEALRTCLDFYGLAGYTP